MGLLMIDEGWSETSEGTSKNKYVLSHKKDYINAN